MKWAAAFFAMVCIAANADDFSPPEVAPEVMTIGRMDTPPTLDGSFADWPADTSVILLGTQENTSRRRVGWTGTADCSGAIRLAWDAKYLYFGAEIADDVVKNADTPAAIWQGDGFELFFNIHPDQQRVDGFWQIALVPPLGPNAKIRASGPQRDFEDVEGAAVVRPKGYALECRIPWKNLTGFTPENGTSLGFQVYINDRDANNRKTQLMWYPSAISFSRPRHTNILLLRDQGDTTLPRIVAGPTTWCVTHPETMRLSAIANAPGARTAHITRLANPKETVAFDLAPAGESIAVGQGQYSIKGLEGETVFEVAVQDATGTTLDVNYFTVNLMGTRFVEMQKKHDALKKRIAALGNVDEEAFAGLKAWMTRLSAFYANEAHPTTLSGFLCDRMLAELRDLENALALLESGKDPYTGRTGAFVRAYRSPLTQGYRACGLYVPETYTGKEPMPLVLFLHAIFADERQISTLTPHFRDLGAIVLQAPSYRQFDWSGVSAAETWAGLEYVRKHYNIDPERITLFGIHGGGRGAWQLASGRPDIWAAAAPLLSGIDARPNYPALRLYPEYYETATRVRIPYPQYKTPPPPEAITSPLERKLFEKASLAVPLENIKTLPLRSAYGEDGPDGAAERLAMQKRFANMGVPLRTHYEAGMMHGSMPDESRDPNFYRWLVSHKRPPYPHKVSLTVPELRYNTAWWVRVDALTSPAEIAQVHAEYGKDNVTVQTKNVSAFSLLLDERLAPAPSVLPVVIDGCTIPDVKIPATISFIRTGINTWKTGPIPAGKRHGLSGPINDFQFDRFIFVYGTQGDKAQQEKRVRKMADWGLGAVFTVKADTEITEDDMGSGTIICVGTPADNVLLRKMEKQLPIAWKDQALEIGGIKIEKPGAGACLIYPNPLAPGRYVVVVSAVDEPGYAVWNFRDPGGDYVMGNVTTLDGKSAFNPLVRGWFDNQWTWQQSLTVQ